MKGRQMTRLIATDLDGTFLAEHSTIHPKNLRVLRRAMAQGIHFAVASGRGAEECSVLLRTHGIEDAHIIGSNGCKVLDKPFGKTLALHFLAAGAARRVIDIFAEHQLAACIYTEDAIVFTDERVLAHVLEYHAEDGFIEAIAAAGVEHRAGPAAVQKALNGNIMKAYCTRHKGYEAAFDAAKKACAAVLGVSLTSSWIDNFEVMPEGIDKGQALCELASRLGIAQSEVVAFGDSDNDIPMLRWAGHGIAMENAQPEVKAIADAITGPCWEGGVAQQLMRMMDT